MSAVRFQVVDSADRPMLSRATIPVLACVVIFYGTDRSGLWRMPELWLLGGALTLPAVVGLEIVHRFRRRRWHAALGMLSVRDVVHRLGIEDDYQTTLWEIGRVLCEQPGLAQRRRRGYPADQRRLPTSKLTG